MSLCLMLFIWNILSWPIIYLDKFSTQKLVCAEHRLMGCRHGSHYVVFCFDLVLYLQAPGSLSLGQAYDKIR